MTDAPPIRDRMLAAMAAHVLRNGLTGASLRPLARAAGTSDRMLIYHFGSKERLVADLLVHLAGDFERLLSALTPGGRFASADEAVARLVAAQMRPEVADYVRLWLEIVAAAARGSHAHRAAGAAILDGLSAWLIDRLPAAEPDPHAAARDVLVRIEGTLVLWALGADRNA
jgi:AcrR family transcriptional regulator